MAVGRTRRSGPRRSRRPRGALRRSRGRARPAAASSSRSGRRPARRPRRRSIEGAAGERAQMHPPHPACADDGEPEPLACHGRTIPRASLIPRCRSSSVSGQRCAGRGAMRIGLVLEAFLDRPARRRARPARRARPEVTDLEVGVGGFAPAPHCDVAAAAADASAARSGGWPGSRRAASASRPSTCRATRSTRTADSARGTTASFATRSGSRPCSASTGSSRWPAARPGAPGDRTAHFDAGGWLPYLAGIYERQWGDAVRPYWEEISALAAAEHPVARDLPGAASRQRARTTSRRSSGSRRSATTSPRTSIRAISSGSRWIRSRSPSSSAAADRRTRTRRTSSSTPGRSRLNGLLDHRWTATDRRCALDVRDRGPRPRRRLVARVPRGGRRLRRRDDLDRARGSDSATRGRSPQRSPRPRRSDLRHPSAN